MERIEIIDAVGREYATSNIENGEFSYPKAFKEKNLEFDPIKKKRGKGSWQFLDLRFELDGVSLLIETKNDAVKWLTVEEQIAAYVEYEKRLTGNKIIAMVANTTNDNITVWKSEVEDDRKLTSEEAIRTMPEYVEMFDAKHTNNKEEVMHNTYKLNELLHKHGIGEKLRSQFVGTCLLAIKYGLIYDRKMETAQIISGIRAILENLLEGSLEKAKKLTLIDERVLKAQDIRDMDSEILCEILDFIKTRIFPFINDKSTAGQDLLNLFFITFNKYVGKSDKNQAFTPDHITDFMTKICNVNKNSVVLDMTCGSGSFLVRAMTQALADCHTQAEEDEVKKHHIYGVEFDEVVYGLATTNMLIHSDGNSNILLGSCFDEVPRLIADGVRFNVVLMNPPYNAMAKQVPKDYAKTWGKNKQDPSKGLYFLKFILDQMNEHEMQGKLAVLLPMACAIGTTKLIKQMKNAILKNNTLDAVFSLPDDVFYPGASACACCMVFDVGTPHKSANRETFFAYCKDDGFKKRKNLGRVEQMDENGNSLWSAIQKKWLGTYKNRDVIPGFSARQMVTGDDEWLCEAYMETDYTTLTDADIRQTVNDYLAYLVKTGMVGEADWKWMKSYIGLSYDPPLEADKSTHVAELDTPNWAWFELGGDEGLFDIRKGKRLTSEDQTEGDTPYIGAIDSNNGVSNLIGQSPIHEGNTISLSYNGSVGEAFYHPLPYWATDDVNALYLRPGYGTLCPATGLFVCSVLKHDKYRYSYGRKWTLDKMKTTKIKLPATADGKPDWQWMENYIKSLPYGDRL